MRADISPRVSFDAAPTTLQDSYSQLSGKIRLKIQIWPSLRLDARWDVVTDLPTGTCALVGAARALRRGTSCDSRAP